MALATFQPDSPCLRFCDCEKSLLGLTWPRTPPKGIHIVFVVCEGDATDRLANPQCTLRRPSLQPAIGRGIADQDPTHMLACPLALLGDGDGIEDHIL